jgi:hypothetical protein
MKIEMKMKMKKIEKNNEGAKGAEEEEEDVRRVCGREWKLYPRHNRPVEA